MSEIVLVVDDNPTLVNGVKLTLEMERYQVLTALSGAEALEILERITPDLIMADIMMPEMDGYELYERVHSDPRWVQVPFIFLTAKTDQADIRRGKEMGADDYITKPFDPQDLVAAVRGRVKRMAEVTGRPSRGDVAGNIRYLWRSRLGPIPMPVVVLLLVALLVVLPLLMVSQLFSGERVTTGDTVPTDLPAPRDVGEMIAIPAGEFLMGGSEDGGARQVSLEAFDIDKYEVTNGQYRLFAEENDLSAPPDVFVDALVNHPVAGISWDDAQAYCAWAGKRLPTESEWEKAARGTEGMIYPWGNAWEAGVANTIEYGAGSTLPVGSLSDSASPYGVEDMAGNVWEWVDGSSGQGKVIRGGSYNAISDWARTFASNQVSETYQRENLGFRCAR